MSVGAVAARTSIALSIIKMDQKEPKCIELAEELDSSGNKLGLDLDLDQLNQPSGEQQQEEDEDDDEIVMLQQQQLTSQQETSEAESERFQVDAQLRAMAVSATTQTTPTGQRTNVAARAHHDTAPSTATSTGTRSAGESLDDVYGKNRLRPFIRTCQKFESGSGSGDQDGMVSMEDGTDVAAKKRKTRRGKPKHRKLKPYSKQQPSYQQRLRCRATGRPNKAGRSNNLLAPYNTNQFLMEDHNELPDLDEKIAAGAAFNSLNSAAGDLDFSKPFPPPARTRDSSFSIDSDEDFYYSSPEDEEEFLSKEFSNVYEETHAERLSALSKTQLIAEYIQLEAKVDSLTKRLRTKNSCQQQQSSSAAGPNESRDASDLAKKLKAFQQRLDELQQQNEQLRRENDMLRQRHGSSMSSVDSESDSDSSSSRSRADSDCSDCQHKASPGSSPVPASYHASCREKNSRRKNSSVSSVASETESSTSNDNPSPGLGGPGKSTVTTPSNNSPKHHLTAATPKANGTPEITANGHATSFEVVGLPT